MESISETRSTSGIASSSTRKSGGRFNVQISLMPCDGHPEIAIQQRFEQLVPSKRSAVMDLDPESAVLVFHLAHVSHDIADDQGDIGFRIDHEGGLFALL